ncbi:MAG: hypothetical protein KAR06_01995, partial [Deltaproteobacteria bacterium]|nr:hypothetical protein [Deltaproteobacteria bacterium]
MSKEKQQDLGVLEEKQVSLEYSGARVKHGGMDAYQVAANIRAFSDYLNVITGVMYGEAKFKSEVVGFRGQSFDIDFLYKAAGVYTSVAAGTALPPKDVLYLIKETIKAWIFLDGKPPSSIEKVEQSGDGQLVATKNHKGDIINFNNSTINIVLNEDAGKAVEQFVKKSLRLGMNSLSIKSDGDEITKIDKKQAGSFVPHKLDDVIKEGEAEIKLRIEAPTFIEGNKWRFSDGSQKFLAKIDDEEFLAKVDKGVERFGKGDELFVIMRTVLT